MGVVKFFLRARFARASPHLICFLRPCIKAGKDVSLATDTMCVCVYRLSVRSSAGECNEYYQHDFKAWACNKIHSDGHWD